MVDDTRLELVTSRTSSGCATSCGMRYQLRQSSISLDNIARARGFVKRFLPENQKYLLPVRDFPAGLRVQARLLHGLRLIGPKEAAVGIAPPAAFLPSSSGEKACDMAQTRVAPPNCIASMMR